jgi:hypothetical protein
MALVKPSLFCSLLGVISYFDAEVVILIILIIAFMIIIIAVAAIVIQLVVLPPPRMYRKAPHTNIRI